MNLTFIFITFSSNFKIYFFPWSPFLYPLCDPLLAPCLLSVCRTPVCPHSIYDAGVLEKTAGGTKRRSQSLDGFLFWPAFTASCHRPLSAFQRRRFCSVLFLLCLPGLDAGCWYIPGRSERILCSPSKEGSFLFPDWQPFPQTAYLPGYQSLRADGSRNRRAVTCTVSFCKGAAADSAPG